LLFALNMGVYTAGFVATGFMSLGMAITISFFAVVAILLKQLLQRMEGKGRWLDAVFHGTELVAALFVIFLGGVLLAGRLL
jgi:ABC-type nickel/cobalt efflux system permease component RcnA